MSKMFVPEGVSQLGAKGNYIPLSTRGTPMEHAQNVINKAAAVTPGVASPASSGDPEIDQLQAQMAALQTMMQAKLQQREEKTAQQRRQDAMRVAAQGIAAAPMTVTRGADGQVTSVNLSRGNSAAMSEFATIPSADGSIYTFRKRPSDRQVSRDKTRQKEVRVESVLLMFAVCLAEIAKGGNINDVLHAFGFKLQDNEGNVCYDYEQAHTYDKPVDMLAEETMGAFRQAHEDEEFSAFSVGE